jgi:hypothetical protein
MKFFKILLDLLILINAFAAKLVLTLLEIIIILYSKGKQVVKNILIISTKVKKFWSLKKFGRLIAFAILFYQIISVTITYLGFETVIDMKAIRDLGKHKPTITFCLENDFEFPKINLNSWLKGYDVLDPIACKFIVKTRNEFVNCSLLTKIIESVTPFSRRCLSYFGQYSVDENITNEIIPNFFVDNNLNVFGLLHQKRTPPHFLGQRIQISKSTIHLIDCIRTFTKLLPFPYSTDCYYYRNEEKSILNYKSKEDCIVKHLEKKEFFECGCNEKWFYGYLESKNFSNICPKSFKCKFDAKSAMKSLDKICKKNCWNEYYMNVIEMKLTMKEISELDIKAVSVKQYFEKHEILFNYLPKINLVEYLCSVGGLISMWFGISFYDLVLIFFQQLKRNLIHRIVSINYRYIRSLIVKFKRIMPSKVDHIFSSVTIIVFSVLMFIQIIAIISSYLASETITRFEVNEIKILPKIVFRFDLMPNNNSINKLNEIYPQMKQEIQAKYNIKNKNYSQNLKFSHFLTIHSKYLKRLLIDKRLNDFHKITETNKLIKTCRLKIENGFDLMNCNRGEFGVVSWPGQHLLVTYLSSTSQLIDRNRIEKIYFFLNNFTRLQSVELSLYESQPIPKYDFTIKFNTKTTITFSSFLVKQLESNENKCITEEREKEFNEQYFDLCFDHCFYDLINKSFGCISIDTGIHLYFDRYFLKKFYKFCDISHDLGNISSENYVIENISRKCRNICKMKCNSLNFDIKIHISKHVLNETVLEVIPKKSPRIAYIETLKTDFNRLIYNCGGVLGLWFGISAMNAVDLLRYIAVIYWILFRSFLKFTHVLKIIWIRINGG